MNNDNEFTVDTYYSISAVRKNGIRVYCSYDEYEGEYYWSVHSHNGKKFETVKDIPNVLPGYLFGGLVAHRSQIEILEIKSVARCITSHFGVE